MPRIKCLSIRQPMVEQIMRGQKRVENRSWRTDYRGLLGIHASKNRAELACFEHAVLNKLWPDGEPPDDQFGRLIGTVELVDCCRHADLPPDLADHEHADDDPDNWCWVLRQPKRLAKPVPATGNAGFFYIAVPPSALAR